MGWPAHVVRRLFEARDESLQPQLFAARVSVSPEFPQRQRESFDHQRGARTGLGTKQLAVQPHHELSRRVPEDAAVRAKLAIVVGKPRHPT